MAGCGRALFVCAVAAFDIVEGVSGEYLAAATKTIDTGQGRRFEAQVRTVYKQMAWITIQPRWARYYDFGFEPLTSCMPSAGSTSTAIHRCRSPS